MGMIEPSYRDGYDNGYDNGFADGHAKGLAAGRAEYRIGYEKLLCWLGSYQLNTHAYMETIREEIRKNFLADDRFNPRLDTLRQEIIFRQKVITCLRLVERMVRAYLDGER